MIALPTPFRLEFEISTEGYDNVWDAVGATLAESVQPSDAIHNIEYIATTDHGWPVVLITFASIECAKAFTYAYLGYTLDNADQWDVHTDDQVSEYIRTGQFVEG